MRRIFHTSCAKKTDVSISTFCYLAFVCSVADEWKDGRVDRETGSSGAKVWDKASRSGGGFSRWCQLSSDASTDPRQITPWKHLYIQSGLDLSVHLYLRSFTTLARVFPSFVYVGANAGGQEHSSFSGVNPPWTHNERHDEHHDPNARQRDWGDAGCPRPRGV